MKKYAYILTATALLLTGCVNKEEPIKDTSTGPVQTEETMTNEEKILFMVQSCIDDYNNDRIQERIDYYQITIPPLPLELDSLPQINALSDLSEVKEDEHVSNTYYVGTYTVADKYEVRFKIYHPSSSNFWANADIEFRVKPDNIVENDGQFADTRNLLNPLLANADNILQQLYGINVNYDMDDTIGDGYYRFLPSNGQPETIEGMKGLAESIYTTDFLQANYYPTAFEGEVPVYKDVDGTLYVRTPEELTSSPLSLTYDSSHIVAVRNTGDTILIDILTTITDQLQPTIYRLTLVNTENGYRFPSSI